MQNTFKHQLRQHEKEEQKLKVCSRMPQLGCRMVGSSLSGRSRCVSPPPGVLWSGSFRSLFPCGEVIESELAEIDIPVHESYGDASESGAELYELALISIALFSPR